MFHFTVCKDNANQVKCKIKTKRNRFFISHFQGEACLMKRQRKVPAKQKTNNFFFCPPRRKEPVCAGGNVNLTPFPLHQPSHPRPATTFHFSTFSAFCIYKMSIGKCPHQKRKQNNTGLIYAPFYHKKRPDTVQNTANGDAKDGLSHCNRTSSATGKAAGKPLFNGFSCHFTPLSQVSIAISTAQTSLT